MPSIRPPREKAIIIASGTVSNIPRLGQAWSPASAASPGRRLEGLRLEQRIFRRVIFGLRRIYRAARLARVEFAGRRWCLEDFEIVVEEINQAGFRAAGMARRCRHWRSIAGLKLSVVAAVLGKPYQPATGEAAEAGDQA